MIKFTPEPPPEISGDTNSDLQALRDYLDELVDELEYLINKGDTENE